MPRRPRPDHDTVSGPRIARILPRRVRERVFLPAYYDLLLLEDETGETSSRTTRGRVLGLVAESIRVGGVDWMIRDRKLVRAGRAVLSIGLLLMTLWLWLVALGGGY